MAATAVERETQPAPGAAPDKGAAKENAAAAPGSRKRLLSVTGLVVGIVLAAYGAFLVATPGSKTTPRFAGPFTTELFSDKYQVNLAGSGMKRFLQLTLSVIYEAYDETYVVQRNRDPLYEPYLQSTVLAVCSTKTLEEVQGRASQDALMEELRVELEPVLFPIHVGPTKQALALDPASGLRPGLSADRSSFRGPFHEHRLAVDAAQRTVRLDDGQPTRFNGNETDLVVPDAEGRTLHLDVTGLVPGFVGEVQVGTYGRIRRILPKYFLVQ